MQQEGTNAAAPALAPEQTAEPQDGPASSHDARRDIGTALRNGIKLGSSLLATWSVALVLRLLLSRFLGPELYGTVNFSDNFSSTYFALLGLGVDTYVQRELPVRPQHASDFFGGLYALRLL